MPAISGQVDLLKVHIQRRQLIVQLGSHTHPLATSHQTDLSGYDGISQKEMEVCCQEREEDSEPPELNKYPLLCSLPSISSIIEGSYCFIQGRITAATSIINTVVAKHNTSLFFAPEAFQYGYSQLGGCLMALPSPKASESLASSQWIGKVWRIIQEVFMDQAWKGYTSLPFINWNKVPWSHLITSEKWSLTVCPGRRWNGLW